ncbi:CHAP domain-containing protein [Brucella anthropi]|uniref:CHAP domain-containing protein n=1 Tax=Brucella anthropi TaxID=529 RepID=UPI00124EA0ED|nr:CHAP domain-containing protein [Brucella anthropi]KAB2784739.1 CHAP domain-containing protein [Brucella anthropi]QOD67018.1 CHAP domain-containing protein [Ochrobactrum sp. MT180101]
MLVLGDRGTEVKALVTKLRKVGFALKPTDVFDNIVKKSLEAFQIANVDASGQPLNVDGKLGPNTDWALDAALGNQTLDVKSSIVLPDLAAGKTTGSKALSVAMNEMNSGCGEQGADNRGPDVRRYLNGKAPEGSSWCAGFVSYCFQEALEKEPVFGYLVGAQALHNRMRSLGYAYHAAMTEPPQPGDIIAWKRVDPTNPKETYWQGHIGVVHSFMNGILWTIEGNRGPYPAFVRAFRYSWADLVVSSQADKFKGLYGLSRHP